MTKNNSEYLLRKTKFSFDDSGDRKNIRNEQFIHDDSSLVLIFSHVKIMYKNIFHGGGL